MIYKSVFVMMTIFSILKVNAQTKIQIAVKDARSGIPLASASVKVSINSVQQSVKLTDHNGYVTLNSLEQGKYHIETSFIGYGPIDTVVLAGHKDLMVIMYLNQVSNSLNVVKIKSSKPLLQMKHGNLIINVEQNPLMHSGNIWDLLKFVPSVQSSNLGAISVKSQNATVYIDGRRLYLTGEQLKSYLESISASNIESVTVVSNPDAKYASDIQSVIEIKTKHLDIEGFRAMINYSVAKATYFRNIASSRLDFKKGIFDGQLGYSFSEAKQLEDKNYKTNFDNRYPWEVSQQTLKKNHNNKVYANMGLKPTPNSTILLYGEINPNHNNSYIDSDNGRMSEHRLMEGDSTFMFHSSASSRITSKFVQSSYQLDWDSTKQSVKVQVEYFDNRKNFSNNRNIISQRYTEVPVMKYFEDKLPQAVHTVTSSAYYTRSLFAGTLTSGVRFSNNDLTNDNNIYILNANLWNLAASSRFQYIEKNYSAFTEWSKESGKLYYRLGLRLEKNEITAKDLIPHLSSKLKWLNLFPSLLLQWSAKEHSIFNLSYKKTITRPDYSLLNPFQRFTDNSIASFRGNQGIKPQIDHTLDLSWTDNRMFSGAIGSQYLKNFISTIILLDETQNLYQQYDNFKAFVYYANINITTDPVKWLKIIGSSNFAYYNATYSKVEKSRATPVIDLKLLSAVTFKHNWIAQVSSYYVNSMNDGYFMHYHYSNISAAVQKKFVNPNVSITCSANDIFKQEMTAEKSLYKGLSYQARSYNDIQLIRLSVSWNFGKQKVKSREKEESESKDAIGRVK